MLLCRCFDKLEHAEEFLNGKIRMMSLKYYRTKESDENGRKDKYEGAEELLQGEHTVLRIGDREITSADGLISLVIRSKNHEENTKICCCTTLSISDIVDELETLKKFKLSYTVIFTNPNEFIKRFRNASKDKNWATGKVSFFDEKIYHGELTAFMKPQSFKWQNEFRLSLQSPKKDPFYLNVGDLHDIAIVYKTNDLISALEKIVSSND